MAIDQREGIARIAREALRSAPLDRGNTWLDVTWDRATQRALIEVRCQTMSAFKVQRGVLQRIEDQVFMTVVVEVAFVVSRGRLVPTEESVAEMRSREDWRREYIAQMEVAGTFAAGPAQESKPVATYRDLELKIGDVRAVGPFNWEPDESERVRADRRAARIQQAEQAFRAGVISTETVRRIIDEEERDDMERRKAVYRSATSPTVRAQCPSCGNDVGRCMCRNDW